MFIAAITALPLNMVVPSLANIARDLSADFALVNVAVAGYAAVSALTYLLAGALSDRFGRRPVIVTALAILTLASAACSLVDSIGMFLACPFRMKLTTRSDRPVAITVHSSSMTPLRRGSGP
ncbi:MFS transporter [Labrys miyagiensis]|nr:MFS transporter [Labrys miyagiensis]